MCFVAHIVLGFIVIIIIGAITPNTYVDIRRKDLQAILLLKICLYGCTWSFSFSSSSSVASICKMRGAMQEEVLYMQCKACMLMHACIHAYMGCIMPKSTQFCTFASPFCFHFALHFNRHSLSFVRSFFLSDCVKLTQRKT